LEFGNEDEFETSLQLFVTPNQGSLENTHIHTHKKREKNERKKRERGEDRKKEIRQKR